MTTLIADCETDGLLHELTKLHCLGFADLDTGAVSSFADQPGHRPIAEGLEILAEADMTVWHNGIKFDIPAIRQVYPWWKPRGIIRDSLLTASIVWPKNPTLFDIDRKLREKGKLPGNLMGSHSLKAWGYRVGEWKGDYTGGWSAWSTDMHSYMEQDCRTTTKLWRRITKELTEWQAERKTPIECVELEHEVAWIIARQERYGVGFDMAAAAKLLGELTQRKTELAATLADVFPPKVIKEPFTPKRPNKAKGWTAGVTIFREKVIPFNPNSRQQVAERLLERGAVFTDRTASGQLKIDDDILRAQPSSIPEAKQLAELFALDKKIGQLSTGKESLMGHCKAGAIHGSVNTNGAVTGRATHSRPNMNIPKVGKPWGKEFRSLFVDRLGKLVGTDADSLEARVEAGFTVRYDNGAYREMILNGDKSKGTDLHSVNMRAISTVRKVTRDDAKTIKYGWTYGAGDPKLGLQAGAPKDKAASTGARIRKMLLAASPGLAKLVEKITDSLQHKNFLWGLDGRKLVIRSSHSALNTLFQSGGSIIFKKAMVLCDTELTGVLPSVIGAYGPEAATRFVPGKDFEQVLWVHDEVEHDCRPDIAETVGRTMEDAIRRAGEHFKFRCPMKGNSDLGRTWADVH